VTLHPRRTHRPASPAEIDAAAQITADDVNRAAHAYRRNAPRALATLLDAQPERRAPEPAATDPNLLPEV
jgi:hypothetical protein